MSVKRLILIALLLTAACNEKVQSSPDTFTPPSPTPFSTLSPPSIRFFTDRLPALPERISSSPWTLASTNVSTLTLNVPGGCQGVSATIDVLEQKDTVTIRVDTRFESDNAFCGGPNTRDVTLHAPLGARDLRHA